MTTIRLALIILFLPVTASAQNHSQHDASQVSPYVGEEKRAIKSLSLEDIEEIRRGGGWGLARAAELNGVPGPTHLLELADQIGLSEPQREQIEVIRARMQSEAIMAGEKFVEAERALDAAFKQGVPGAKALNMLVKAAGEARASLRLVHLNAHLLTVPLLSKEQVAEYSILRGYSEDPCAAVPTGHNAAMWRLHNGCS
ncbi:MAG: hypothetical protein AAF737_03800 [Pseudomonadota bacterium]